MSIEPFIKRVMNPFTRQEIEVVKTGEICPPSLWGSGPYLRLHAGPVENELTETRRCRIGGPALVTSLVEKFFAAQLDFAELASVHEGALSLPNEGFLALFVDSDPGAKPALQFFEELPETGLAEPGRRLTPRLLPVDPRAEEDFENRDPNAWLAHRVGWGRAPQGDWTELAIHLQLEGAGLQSTAASLREAERRGIDVVALIRGAPKWRLLWELASDEELSFDWGDSRLFVLIRDEDLANRRFDRAELIPFPFS